MALYVIGPTSLSRRVRKKTMWNNNLTNETIFIYLGGEICETEVSLGIPIPSANNNK